MAVARCRQGQTINFHLGREADPSSAGNLQAHRKLRFCTAIKALEEARSAIHRLIRDRRKRLEPTIADRLAARGLTAEWEAHGGIREQTWNAYRFPVADWTVELKFSADPDDPAMYVYDYRGRTYKDSSIVPLGLPWNAADEQVADAFVAQAALIVEEAKAGVRYGQNT